MRKILFICFFVSICCWSQTPILDKENDTSAQTTQFVSIDSLNKIKKNYKFSNRNRLNYNLESIHHFLRILDVQKQIRKSGNKDQEAIIEIEVRAIIFLMHKIHARNNITDSVGYYQQKIALLTNKPKFIGKAYAIGANAYQKNGLIKAAIIQYEKAIKTYTTKYEQIYPLVNLNHCLLKLGSLEHSKRNILKLSQTVDAIPKHPQYANFKELIKIQQAYVLTASKKYNEALNIITTIDTTKLNTKKFLLQYYTVLHQTYKGLGNYVMGEKYFDLRQPKGNKKPAFKIGNVKYYINKLSYALLNNNLKQVDYYFKKVNELTTDAKNYKSYENFEVLSSYYAFKNEYNRAFINLKKANLIKNSNNREMAKERLDVDRFYIQLDEELLKIKGDNLVKDQLIAKNLNLYVSISLVLTIIFAIILYFRKKKHYQYKLELQGAKTIVEAKQAFLENMSHEIRTPITSIIGYLMLLKEHTLAPKKASQYVNIALDNSEKMIASLNSFLTLLKSEKGSLTDNQNTSSKFNFFLKELISFYAPDFKIKTMNFYYKSNILDALVITYDFNKLKIIITNLISNAIKYSHANSDIYLTVNLTETALQITIKDFGFGIAQEDQEKVFSRFYQSQNNMSIGGFGIGLSLVTDLIKNLKGTIRLESEINIGSIFYTDLPYKVDQHSLCTTSKILDFKLLSPDNTIEKDTKKVNNLPKVLIVDDNPTMVAFLTNIFSSFLNCTSAFNGQEALVKVKEESFDIIISDLRMPLLDGAQLKETLNKIDRYKDIPFIMITSVFYDKLKDLKNTLGLNEYIEKPFTKNEITSRVQFALERSVYRKTIFSPDAVSIDFESSETELIEKIKESILSNLTNTDFNVQVLAQMCGYEQKKMNAVLKSKLGLSIVNIILEVRMLKAYELIVKNIHPTLNEVIYAVGMNSRSYFNKKFEERFGVKAGDLKRKNAPLS